ncbi:MAG: RES family NAD+ phosphorylase [Acidobacteriota bacterium]|nr:RES family NAD+ phosphorylase [Acidobacteriota bacterium]
MRVFRLHRGQRLAADYGGSQLYSNRWNLAGTPMLYAASSLSLACLEILVHLMPGQIPPAYVYSSAKLKRRPHVADFHGDVEDEISTRRFGQWWANDRQDVAILVPSVVIPSERNILLNPTHSDFGEIVWDAPKAFGFDPRLLREGTS